MDANSESINGIRRRYVSLASWFTEPKREAAFVWILSALAAGIYALIHGQDINWDQLNYHIYSIYSLLHNRASIDIAPSQLQTWTNPTGSFIQYIIILAFAPKVASVLLAILSSTSAPLVYFLTKNVFDENSGYSKEFRIFIAAIAAIGACSSPLFLSEVSTTFSDYMSSTIVLLALLLWAKKHSAGKYYFICGALLGLALDIKLTNAIFIFGWVAGIVVIENINAIRPLLYSGIGALLAYIPLGGVWNFYVYRMFKNPLFPLYNHIFKSDAYAHIAMLDERFKPKSFVSALGYFPRWILGENVTTELSFRDSRFLIALLLLVLAAPRLLEIFIARDKEDNDKHNNINVSLFIIVFSIFSFATWLAMFGIERYAITLEQIAPLVILILLSLLCATPRIFGQAAAMCLALILATTHAPNWGRVAFGKTWYAVTAPAELQKNDTMFVMLSSEPIAYIIPYLPASDVFIRIEGNMPLDPNMGLGQAALTKIRNHPGEIRTLAPVDYAIEQSKARLASFELVADADNCLIMTTTAGKLRSCRLAPTGR